MSHFTRVRTVLRDRDTLAAALRAVGYAEVEVHDRPQLLHGWGSQAASAEVIVRHAHISGAAGDLGFARGQDGSFEAVMDSMDRARNGPGWLPALTRAYGHAAALRYAEQNGYEVVTDEADHDGTRRLTLRRYV